MKIKGVVFLHDFYDAPHYYGSMIFNDHYEWTNHILNFIKKNNLSIGVKIHPNAVFDSNKIYELFKKIYPNIVWIKKTYQMVIYSNYQILNLQYQIMEVFFTRWHI